MRKVNRIVIRLGIAFGLPIALLLGVGWLGLRWMSRMNAELEDNLPDEWAHVKLSREALLYSNQNFAITMEILKSPEGDDVGHLRDVIENRKNVSAQIAKIKAFGNAPGEEKELMHAVDAARAQYIASRKEALDSRKIQKRRPMHDIF